jgi:two-component sensor histidine kinase
LRGLVRETDCTNLSDELGGDAVRQRNLMMQELNHRSKNILQSISATLSLIAAKTENAEARATLHGAMQRLNVMSEAYAMLYRTGNADLIPCRDYLKQLCETLARALDAGRLRFVVDGDNPLWPQRSVSDLGMLVSEVVMNAIKHAFPLSGQGRITVHLEYHSDRCALQIGDDGIGFEQAKIRHGLGAKLIQAFAQQISGTVEIVSIPGDGTMVRVLFPPPA